MKLNMRKLIPLSIKRAAKARLASYRIWRATRAIVKLRRGEVPTRRMLRLLSAGWGNDGFAPTLDYLEEVARSAATTEGPILECGSGLTTLLLGLLAGRRGVAIHSLEHSANWQQRIAKVLSENAIRNVEVMNAPLRDYGAFAWYDVRLEQLPEQFRLIVCDGPPGNTKGGRYGLLPLVGERLPQGGVIVLDDADRPGELEMVRRWKKEMDLAMQVFEKPAGNFARLVRCS
jgi:predicted O-methyltransferase YrrM